ncbi:MAG: hypothetical protein AB7O67_04750 [Vicinamibacterales bacterium]
MPAALQTVMTSWAVYYADHQLASAIVRYLHLAGLLVGGGTALAIDRQVLLSARRGMGARASAVAALDGSHAVVVPALALVVATGVLMALADLSTFLDSGVFWFKMAAVGLLLANGAGLVVSERAFLRSGAVVAWRRLVVASGVSFVLWLVILWLGAWLTVAA